MLQGHLLSTILRIQSVPPANLHPSTETTELQDTYASGRTARVADDDRFPFVFWPRQQICSKSLRWNDLNRLVPR